MASYWSADEIDAIKTIRHKARTDLLFLCTELLDYRDITHKVHDPYISRLTKITEGTTGTDLVTSDRNCLYIPQEEIPGVDIAYDVKRNYLVLGFRSSLKTTVNTIAHTIQLILKYPHITIAIYHATEDNAKIILKEIVWHFTENERMKEVFPEFCIHNRDEIKIYHKALEFTTPARYHGNTSLAPLKKEPTISALGLDTTQAGRHFQVIKMTDVVERSNSQSPAARKKVADGIKMAKNLLEDGSCFLFVEGTPYHPEDAYCEIIQKEWEQLLPEKREWEMVYHPAYLVDTKGKPRRYTPDEMSLPFARAKRDIEWAPGIITRKGQRIPAWPVWKSGTVKFDNLTLESKERDDTYIFACQQLLRPADADTSIFPVQKCLNFFPASQLHTLNLQLKVMTVDTAASTDPNYSNDTAISCGMVTDGLLTVISEGVCGLLDETEIVEALFHYNAIFKPDILLIESTMFTQGLIGQIREQEIRRRVNLPRDWVKRAKNVAKKARIQGALKSPLTLGRFKFSTGLSKDYIERVRLEMSGFPTSKHDDILDTLEMIATASAGLASLDTERAQLRAATEAEHEAIKAERDAWVRKMTCQLDPSDYEEPLSESFTSYGM